MAPLGLEEVPSLFRLARYRTSKPGWSNKGYAPCLQRTQLAGCLVKLTSVQTCSGSPGIG